MTRKSLLYLLTVSSFLTAIATPIAVTKSVAETLENPLISQGASNPMMVRDIKGFNGIISSLAISEVNNILLVSTRDGTVTGINLLDLQPLYKETFVYEPRSLVITADQTTFITASDKEIRLFNLQDGLRGKRWLAHAGKVTKLALSPGNELLASISAEDGTVKLWELQQGTLLQTFGEHTGPLTAVTFSPNGKLLVTGASGTDRTLKFWDTEALALIRTSPQQPGYIYDIAITADGNKLVAAVRNRVKVWDLNNGQELLTVKAADLD